MEIQHKRVYEEKEKASWRNHKSYPYTPASDEQQEE